MAEIFQKPVKVKNLIALDVSKARALEDPLRIRILDFLIQKPMSIEDLAKELKERGIEKAPTTIRHHIEILKKAGLIELTRLKEARGGMLKYYASNTKILNYKIPEDFDDRLKTSIEKAREEVKHLLAKLLQEHGEEIKAVAEDLKPCPYCSTQHFIEYVLIQILNRALVEALQEHRYPALEGM